MNSLSLRIADPDARRLWALLLACFLPVVVSGQSISAVKVDTPRDFAYTIGDTIRHEMRLTLKEPYRIDLSSLPEPGRLNRWLEITDATITVKYEGQDAHYLVGIEYQIFNAPRKLATVTIPQLEFLTMGGMTSIPVFVPEWTFTITPLVGNVQQLDLALRPDQAARPIPIAGRVLRFRVALVLLASILLYLAYRTWLRPRLKRDQYPFSAAFSSLQKLQSENTGFDQYKIGLRVFHAAINRSAGKVVFAENLPNFLANDSPFMALKEELAALYVQSHDVFFVDRHIAEPDKSMRELIDLCRRCRSLERSAA